MCFRCARRQAGLQTRSDVRREAVPPHKRQNNIRRSALRVYIDSPGFAASIDRRFGPFSLHQPNRVELSLYDSIHSYKQGRAANMARGLLSSNITVSGFIARSDHQPEIQVHSDAHSHRESIKRDNDSEIGIGSTHLD